MGEEESAPILVFAPFVASTMRVEPAWIDYNGHMNMAYYLVVFDHAVEEAFALLGLGPEYVEERNASYFTAEVHILYRRELTVGTAVRTTVRLIDHDEKRIHAYFEIHHLEEGWVAASCEKLFVHVGLDTRKVVPFPRDIQANLAVMRAAHGQLPLPSTIGRSVALKPRPAPTETRH